LPISREHLIWVDVTSQAISFFIYLGTRRFVFNRAGRHSTLKLFGWYALFALPSEIYKDIALGVSTKWSTDHPVIWLVVPTSCAVVAIWVTLSNLTVNWFSAARVALGELKMIEASLSKTRFKLRTQLTNDLERLRAQVQEALVPTIETLRERLRAQSHTEDSTLLKSASEIRDFCELEVRALSHEIAERGVTIDAPQTSSRLGFVTAALTVVRNGDITLNRMFAAILSLGIPYALNSSGIQAVFVTVLGLTIGYAILRLIDPTRRRVFGSKGAGSFFSALMMYLSISVIGVWALNELLPLYPSLWDYVDTLSWLLPAMLIFLWVILGFVFGANDVLQASIDKLRAANEALAHENERLQTLVTAARNRIYRLLHGAIQGRLAAVSLALTAIVNENDEKRREALMAQAVDQIALAEADLRNAFDVHREDEAAQSRLENMAAAWRNLLEIRLDVPSAVIKLLDESELLGGLVLTAIQEGITNAHRHAHARSVSVALSVVGECELRLNIVNDVAIASVVAAREGGTGLEQIAAGAKAFDFAIVEGAATLTAVWQVPTNQSGR
jgi:signal transduction histidine kinase